MYVLMCYISLLMLIFSLGYCTVPCVIPLLKNFGSSNGGPSAHVLGSGGRLSCGSCHAYHSPIFLIFLSRVRICTASSKQSDYYIILLNLDYQFSYLPYRFKTVGPFVVMIYRMITGDLLRFVLIYLVFVMGFSQAFFIIFLSFNKPDTPNPLGSPADSGTISLPCKTR